jgi:hypothetical protein
MSNNLEDAGPEMAIGDDKKMFRLRQSVSPVVVEVNCEGVF